MQLNYEEIRVLIIEKIAGSIEPADDVIIEQLINDDQHVLKMWLAISEEVREAESLGFSLNVDEQQQWNRLEPLMTNPSSSKMKVLAIRMLAAATIFAVVATGYWWLQSGKSSADPSSASSLSAIKIKVPTLELPNHQVVELTGIEHKKIRISDAVFEIKGKTLRYTTAPGNNQNWTLSIPPGSDYKIQLSDGTEVWLNAASSLKFPANFNPGTREIYMDGEAFFKVAKNKQSPFIVHTSATEVLVTGTQFNVNTYNKNKVHTALVEGSVILRNENTKEVRLKPGFEAKFSNQLGFETQPFDSLEVLSWMKGIYYFRNTPLKELSEVIKRWYDVDTEFFNSEFQNKTFSGELRKEEPLQSFLENLNLSGDVKGQLKNGKVYFR
ncbi:FecR family protein [Flavitalea sp.]|nr:FecR family protein [Flavitalea sp.]